MKSWEKTLAAELHRLWKRYRLALKKCRTDPREKAVHESRVSSRRLEARFELLKLFAPARLFKRGQRALEKHLGFFDTLRDTQVQLQLLRRNAASVPGTRDLKCFLEDRENCCLKQVAHDIRNVKVHRIKKLVKLLEIQLKRAGRNPDRIVRDHRAIIRAVDTAQARLLERLRRMDPGHVATIHRTRVAFKKLRYMLEAVQPLFPGLTRARLNAMDELQDNFGTLNDTDVFLDELDSYLDRHKTHASRLAPFRHWLLTRRNSQIQFCIENSGRLKDFWPLSASPQTARSKSKKPRLSRRSHSAPKPRISTSRRS